MSRNQSITLYIVLATGVLMGAFPPWKYTSKVHIKHISAVSERPAGYAFIGTPPIAVPNTIPIPQFQMVGVGVSLDAARLVVQYLVLMLIGAGAFWACRGGRSGNDIRRVDDAVKPSEVHSNVGSRGATPVASLAGSDLPDGESTTSAHNGIDRVSVGAQETGAAPAAASDLRYQPTTPVHQRQVKPALGGLLVLPALGLLISPVLSAGLIVQGCKSLHHGGTALKGEMQGYVLLTIVLTAILLTFNVVAAVQFFRRQTSAPAAVIGWLLANFLFTGLLAAASSGIPLDTQSAPNIMGATVAAAIWCPYFFMSKRVKATFVN